MHESDLERKYDELGRLLMRDIRGDSGQVFLYAEAGQGWVDASLIKHAGDRLIYRDPSSELYDKISEIWKGTGDDERWNQLFYTMTNGVFVYEFGFNDLDPEVNTLDRHRQILKERFSDLPVDYSDP